MVTSIALIRAAVLACASSRGQRARKTPFPADARLKKRIGVIIYQTSKSKGQELVAERMMKEFIRLGHETFLVTRNYHDGTEAVSSADLANSGK